MGPIGAGLPGDPGGAGRGGLPPGRPPPGGPGGDVSLGVFTKPESSGYSGLDLLIYVLAFGVSIISLTFLLTSISSKTPNSLIPIVITHFSFHASLNLVDARGLGLGPTLSLLAITAGIHLVTAILVWSASGWSTQKTQGD